MQTENTKAFLEKYRVLEFEKAVLEQILRKEWNDKVQCRLEELKAQIEIIDLCLSILNTDEIFVIKNRSFSKMKRDAITDLYEKTFGIEYTKSERTLKLIHANALKKITVLVNETNTNKYIIRMLS